MNQSMKLVDILAREMKVWPEGVACLSQNRLNGYIINGKGFDGRAFDCFEIAADSRPAGVIVTREQWQAAVDALKAAAWNGEGLPPVGAACEFQGDIATCPSDPWKKGLHDGLECRVIAHFKSKSLDLVAFTFTNPDGNTEVEQALPGALRPIRTAEQIAADERQKKITEALDAINNRVGKFNVTLDCSVGMRATVEAMIDAGYSK